MRPRWLACSCLLLAGAAGASGPYPIDDNIPQAKASRYSARICSVLKRRPPPGLPESASTAAPLWMAAIKTPEDEAVVGIAKRMWIAAPVAAVADIMTDFEGYKARVPDFKEVRVLGRDANRVTVFWRSKSPVFFAPETRYEQIWVVDRGSPGRVVLRHQLKSGNHLRSCDGLIVLESAREGGSTRLTTFDFFEPDLGLLAKIAPLRQVMRRVWKDTFEAYYRGDIALKARAEHPDWSAERIQKEAGKALEARPGAPVETLDASAFEP